MLTQQLSETAFAHGYAALSRGLWDLGIKDQHVLYLKEEPSHRILYPPGVKIIPSGFKRIALSPIWLAQYIKEAKPDVLISMPVFINIAAIVGKILSGNNRSKLIVSERAVLSYYIKTERRKNPRYLILPTLLKRLYPKVDGLVANNDSVLKDLSLNLRILIDDIPHKVIPPAIDIETIRILKEKVPGKKINELIKKPLLVSVGRLAKEKNFKLLIRAFKIIRECIDARLIILGDGPERNNLVRLISQIGVEEVYLPGYVDNPWSIMARSDIFVLSSEKEAFGRVLVEAMVCEIPVVATDAIGDGPRFVLKCGEYGALVQSNNDKALAEAIIQLLGSNDLRNRFIEYGKIRSKDFLPKSVAKEWLSFIEQVSK